MNYETVQTDIGVISFEMLTTKFDEAEKEFLNQVLTTQSDNNTLQLQEYRIAPYDKTRNNLPMEIRELIKYHHTLPEVIEKQIRYLYGKGPYLYREEIREDKVVRVPVIDAQISTWLESWRVNGLRDSYKHYLLKVIREYYYTEGHWTQYRLSRGRNLNMGLPVVGLEHIKSQQARMATKNKKYWSNRYQLDNEDFNYVILADWYMNWQTEYEVYHRFDETNPLAHDNAINYTKNDSFGEEIYSYPVWYYGLKEWIKGSNVNPKQLQSFFKNLLTAKYHVKIPGAWVTNERTLLNSIIEQNFELYADEKPFAISYKGLDLIDKTTSEPLRFSEHMITDRIKMELKKLTDMMTGEENAGKIFSSVKYNTEYGLEGWEIEEIPINISNFVDTLINYDKRAVEVILSGKGVDSSLSNVSKDGIISKSGSDLYYNYLIYLNNLAIPEEIVTYDINKAIALNFPAKQGIKLGFLHEIPTRQQETTPSDRLNQTAGNN
jgi:hypothetical protein